MLPSTFSGIFVDEQGREYVTHKPSGTRYYVKRTGDHWSARVGEQHAPNGHGKKAKRAKHKHTKQTPENLGGWPQRAVPAVVAAATGRDRAHATGDGHRRGPALGGRGKLTVCAGRRTVIDW